MPRLPVVPPARRQRILAMLERHDRHPTWMAHQIGRSKQWAHDFTHGRGRIEHDEVVKLCEALDEPISEVWDGVSLPDTSPSQASGQEGARMTEQERMVLSLWRQLPERWRLAALDYLWQLFRKVHHPQEAKR